MNQPLSKFCVLALALLTLIVAVDARAFCGFYVAKADTKIFNRASKVVLVRDADRTVMTMANDFQGDAKDFAVVIPVPAFLERDQIHVGDQKHIDHLDAYSAPRLVEYWDENPCEKRRYEMMTRSAAPMAAAPPRGSARDAALGVTVEAQYTVGEYDIVILSAEQSNGLETWLMENGYRIPSGAGEVLGSYIKQKMRFFVARVNLAEKAKLGFSFLRPLQVAYESPKFMLPIRLGTVNADGPQELFVFALSKQGRVETTNYRTVKLPTGQDLPESVKEDFANFYRAMFSEQVRKENMRVVFQEYAWDMAWCDPCAADPLSAQELRGLGVFWLNDDGGSSSNPAPGNRRPPIVRPPPMPPRGGAPNVLLPPLHVRYDAAHFPEDLVFQQTGDRTNFQGRYVLRHAFTGKADCSEAKPYFASLAERRKAEARNLADLTGWALEEVYRKMRFDPSAVSQGNSDERKWYQRMWGNN